MIQCMFKSVQKLVNFYSTMDIWLKLYSRLNSIVTDQRPEVRHSAIRTLTFVLASNGDQLDNEKWGQCIDIVLSMLNDVHSAALRAERAETSP
jgi:hypothetical protein